jgi:hypothetical protein
MDGVTSISHLQRSVSKSIYKNIYTQIVQEFSGLMQNEVVHLEVLL